MNEMRKLMESLNKIDEASPSPSRKRKGGAKKAIAFLQDLIQIEHEEDYDADDYGDDYEDDGLGNDPSETALALEDLITRIKKNQINNADDIENISSEIYDATAAGGESMYGDTDFAHHVSHTLADLLGIDTSGEVTEETESGQTQEFTIGNLHVTVYDDGEVFLNHGHNENIFLTQDEWDDFTSMIRGQGLGDI